METGDDVQLRVASMTAKTKADLVARGLPLMPSPDSSHGVNGQKGRSQRVGSLSVD